MNWNIVISVLALAVSCASLLYTYFHNRPFLWLQSVKIIKMEDSLNRVSFKLVNPTNTSIKLTDVRLNGAEVLKVNHQARKPTVLSDGSYVPFTTSDPTNSSQELTRPIWIMPNTEISFDYFYHGLLSSITISTNRRVSGQTFSVSNSR